MGEGAHWKVAGQQRSGEPQTEGVARSARLGTRCLGPTCEEKTRAAPTAAPADQLLGPAHPRMTQNAST